MYCMFMMFALAADPVPAPLWLGEAPDSVGEPDANQPSITTYLPPAAKAVGTGVVICPGGGYGFLAVDHEGKQVAQWLNERGVAAFVLNESCWSASSRACASSAARG